MWIEFLAFCAEALAPALGWVSLISLTTGALLAAAPAARRDR